MQIYQKPEVYQACRLCPRACGIDRSAGKRGFCGADAQLRIARAALHYWEEPCISGTEGSGAVFFTGGNLGCVFCQNYEISHLATGMTGTIVRPQLLAERFFALRDQQANNINLVTADVHIPAVAEAIRFAKTQGLSIPVIFNSSAYVTVESLHMLEGLVDGIFRILNFILLPRRQNICAQQIIRRRRAGRSKRWCVRWERVSLMQKAGYKRV